MTEKYRIVKQEAFHIQGQISYQIGVAKNLEWNKYYVTIKRNYIYNNKHGNCKVSESIVYLTLPAAVDLGKQLKLALRYAENCIVIDKVAHILSNTVTVTILSHVKLIYVCTQPSPRRKQRPP